MKNVQVIHMSALSIREPVSLRRPSWWQRHESQITELVAGATIALLAIQPFIK